MKYKPLTEDRVRAIVMEVVGEATEIILDTMTKMFTQQDNKIQRLEQKGDYNQELNNKQFDELKAELSNTVSKKEFNEAKKHFQN